MEYRVASLWLKGGLSYLEQLCLLSYKQAGYHVTLYSYDPLENIPEGIETADASAILPASTILTHKKTGSPALFSNIFRYELLRRFSDLVWVDTDMLALGRLEVSQGYCVGRESVDSINNAVLRLPQDSDTLGLLQDFTADKYPVPPWYPEKLQRKLKKSADKGKPVPAGNLPWGVFGPQALTHFLNRTGESKYALPRHILYPFSYKEYKLPLKPGLDSSRWITPETRAIHFWGKAIRRKLRKRPPRPDSLLGRLLTQYDIDPALAPVGA